MTIHIEYHELAQKGFEASSELFVCKRISNVVAIMDLSLRVRGGNDDYSDDPFGQKLSKKTRIILDSVFAGLVPAIFIVIVVIIYVRGGFKKLRKWVSEKRRGWGSKADEGKHTEIAAMGRTDV